MSEPRYADAFVQLRRPVLGDAESVFELSHDAEVMRYYGMAPFVDLDAARTQIAWYLGLFAQHGGRWAIADRVTDELVGDVGFFGFQAEHRRAEVGFKLASRYWRRGIMRGCLGAVLRHGLVELGYNRIEALVDARNVACCGLLQGAGFVHEGVLREYERGADGYVDMEMYSLLRREYSS